MITCFTIGDHVSVDDNNNAFSNGTIIDIDKNGDVLVIMDHDPAVQEWYDTALLQHVQEVIFS